MLRQTNIEKLLVTGKTAFTVEDLAVIWLVFDRRKLLELIKYYVRSDRLQRVYKGVYTLGGFTKLELAQKLYPLSYLSLYTTSQLHGLTFQYYSTVFCVSQRSKNIEIAGQRYEYHRIQESIFYNQIGLINQGTYTMADRERTICDLLYVFPSASVDNLRQVNVAKLREVAKIYHNAQLAAKVEQLISIKNGG